MVKVLEGAQVAWSKGRFASNLFNAASMGCGLGLTRRHDSDGSASLNSASLTKKGSPCCEISVH